ncbi:MAG TPA: hypothetical protein VI160_01200 [Gemmatimonadales bacterium]
MSRHRAAAVAVAALLAGAPQARGQALDTDGWHHRADSLLALWRQARTFAAVGQALRADRTRGTAAVTRATAERRGQHPVQAGGLMVLSDEPDSIPLRSAVPRAWALLARTYGAAAGPLTAQPVRIHVAHLGRATPPMAESRPVSSTVSADGLARMLLAIVGAPRVDHALQHWLGGGVRPVIDTAAMHGAAYVSLVTAPSVAARGCLQGVPADCRTALELPPDTLFYLTAYDAGERRLAVSHARQSAMLDPPEQLTYAHCVRDGEDGACRDFLRLLGTDQVPRPLPDDARQLLVSAALALGGPGAYDRLVADTLASIPDRIAAAAGAPLDAVITRWRSDVLRARPAPPSVPLADGLLALAWIGVLAGGALTSTRWRLG